MPSIDEPIWPPLPLPQMEGLSLEELEKLAAEREKQARTRMFEPLRKAEKARDDAQANLEKHPRPVGWELFRSMWLFWESPAFKAWEEARRRMDEAQKAFDDCWRPHSVDLESESKKARISVDIEIDRRKRAMRAAHEAEARREEEARRRRPPPTDDDFLKD